MLLATRVELTLVMFMLLIVSVISHDKSHSHLPGKGKLHRRVTIQRDDLKMTSRIWNGSRTSYKVHPYFGLLTLRTTKGCYAPACGGVFITPQVFMTAAHCLMKKQMIPTQSMKIRYGIDRAKTTSGNGHQFGKGFDHSVSKSFVHPLYVPTISRFHTRDQVADIGLVTLSEPIKHTSFIARLPEPDEDIPFLWGGEETSFVGAGTSYGQDAKDYLKEAKVVLYPCSHNQDELDAFQTCSKVEGGSVRGCPGDSGSPFLANGQRREVVIALLSGGHGDCFSEKEVKEEGIMYAARVSPAMPWILNTIMQHTHCHCLDKLAKLWAPYHEENIDLELLSKRHR